MRIRTFSLALLAALAACQGDPTAPDPAASFSGGLMGGGYRTESDSATAFGSPAIGTGLREDGSASVSSGFMGSGSREDGSASLSSTFVGSGSRDDGSASVNSSFIGSGSRTEEEDNPGLGSTGVE